MSVPARDEFHHHHHHHLVDDLPDEQVAPLLALVRASLEDPQAHADAEPDLAARSEDLLRDEIGHCTA